jgi:hypothetical protein
MGKEAKGNLAFGSKYVGRTRRELVFLQRQNREASESSPLDKLVVENLTSI